MCPGAGSSCICEDIAFCGYLRARTLSELWQLVAFCEIVRTNALSAVHFVWAYAGVSIVLERLPEEHCCFMVFGKCCFNDAHVSRVSCVEAPVCPGAGSL